MGGIYPKLEVDMIAVLNKVDVKWSCAVLLPLASLIHFFLLLYSKSKNKCLMAFHQQVFNV